MSGDDNKQTSLLGQTPDSGGRFVRMTEPLEEQVVPWVIEFRVVGTPDILQAPVTDSMLLGRADPDKGITPEIDLTPYSAQQMGVSRAHARISLRDNRVNILDLNSANGTFINNHALDPNRLYRLRDGDILRLGKLELQIHLVVRPYTDDRTMIGASNRIEVKRIASGQHILLLDDDLSVCQVLGNVMTQAGFSVTIVHNVNEAMAAIDEQLPQALVLELVLREGNGLDVVRYLRTQVGQREVPIMALTEATAGYQMGQALEAGIDLFLGKPVAVDELVQTLAKLADLLGAS